MEKKVLFSFIVPVKNMEKYILKCLKSILKQTYDNIELIVIDFGSTDNTIKLIKQIEDKRLKLLENSKVNDVCEARNIGISVAKGMYISFIDADDWVSNKLVEKIVSNLVESNADIGIVNYKNINEITQNEDEKIIEIDESIKITTNNINDFLLKTSIGKVNCEAWNKIYKTEFIKKNNILFNNKYGVNGEDLLFNYMCYIKFPKIIYVDDSLYMHLLRSKSLGKVNDIDVTDRFRYIVEEMKKVSCNDKIDVDEYVAMIFLSLTNQVVCSQKELKKKNKYLKNMLKTNNSMKYLKICKDSNRATKNRKIICYILLARLHFIYLLFTYL